MPVDVLIRSDSGMTYPVNVSRQYVCTVDDQVHDGVPAVTLFGTDHFCDAHATQYQREIERILEEQRTDEGREKYRLELGRADADLEGAKERSWRRRKANGEL